MTNRLDIIDKGLLGASLKLLYADYMTHFYE